MRDLNNYPTVIKLLLLVSMLLLNSINGMTQNKIRVIATKGKIAVINAGWSSGIIKGEKYYLNRETESGKMSIGIVRIEIVKEVKAAIKLIESNGTNNIEKNDFLGDLYDDDFNDFFNTYPNQQNKRISGMDFSFGINAGYFMPSEEALKEIYGGGIIFGGEIDFWNYSGLGGGISIDYFSKSGDPIQLGDVSMIKDANAKITIIPISLTAMYRVKNNNTNVIPFFGAGLGIYMVGETLELDTYEYGSESVSFSKNGIGFHFLGGMQISNIAIIVKYTSASLSTEELAAAGNELNCGGINFFIGLRF